MSEGLYALLGIVAGGAGLELVKRFVLPSEKREDIAAQIRDELRKDISEYKNDIGKLEARVTELSGQLTEWKSYYFRLIEIVMRNNIEIPEDLKWVKFF